jgi:hypothetical protein
MRGLPKRRTSRIRSTAADGSMTLVHHGMPDRRLNSVSRPFPIATGAGIKMTGF